MEGFDIVAFLRDNSEKIAAAISAIMTIIIMVLSKRQNKIGEAQVFHTNNLLKSQSGKQVVDVLNKVKEEAKEIANLSIALQEARKEISELKKCVLTVVQIQKEVYNQTLPLGSVDLKVLVNKLTNMVLYDVTEPNPEVEGGQPVQIELPGDVVIEAPPEPEEVNNEEEESELTKEKEDKAKHKIRHTY